VVYYVVYDLQRQKVERGSGGLGRSEQIGKSIRFFKVNVFIRSNPLHPLNPRSKRLTLTTRYRRWY
jgi:hypothetical protein